MTAMKVMEVYEYIYIYIYIYMSVCVCCVYIYIYECVYLVNISYSVKLHAIMYNLSLLYDATFINKKACQKKLAN